MKQCPKCQQLKPSLEFANCKQNKDGLASYCKQCNNAWHKLHYRANREKVLERNKTHYSKVKKKLSITRRRYYLANRSAYVERLKTYMEDPIKRANKNRAACKRDKERRKTDINYKLKRNLRTRIWNSLKGLYKSKNTENLIGCSIEHLKKYLESKFTDGMSFDNYGKWHVDHIRPCSSFELSKPDEQAACFHYTNLQPLWAKDNISKNNKLIPLANSL